VIAKHVMPQASRRLLVEEKGNLAVEVGTSPGDARFEGPLVQKVVVSGEMRLGDRPRRI